MQAPAANGEGWRKDEARLTPTVPVAITAFGKASATTPGKVIASVDCAATRSVAGLFRRLHRGGLRREPAPPRLHRVVPTGRATGRAARSPFLPPVEKRCRKWARNKGVKSDPTGRHLTTSTSLAFLPQRNAPHFGPVMEAITKYGFILKQKLMG